MLSKKGPISPFLHSMFSMNWVRVGKSLGLRKGVGYYGYSIERVWGEYCLLYVVKEMNWV